MFALAKELEGLEQAYQDERDRADNAEEGIDLFQMLLVAEAVRTHPEAPSRVAPPGAKLEGRRVVYLPDGEHVVRICDEDHQWWLNTYAYRAGALNDQPAQPSKKPFALAR